MARQAPTKLYSAHTMSASPCIQQPVADAELSETVADAELVARVLGGEPGAYDLLVRRHSARIYGAIYRVVGQREEAEDLTQEAFFKAYRALRRFKGRSQFSTWLYRIALNLALNQLKRARRRPTLSLDADPGEGGHAPPLADETREGASPLDELERQELRARLNAALEKLSKKHREVVFLAEWEGLPHEEIGRLLNCRPATVRTRLFYARRALQAELKDLMT